MKCSKCGAFTDTEYFLHETAVGAHLCATCHNNIAAFDAAKKSFSQTKGEVSRLPKANSPMFTEQWSVVGSAKLPYIISRKGHVDGSTTGERFCCSCPAFTRNTPREDCKHILKVKLFEGMSLTAQASGVPASHAKEYAEFLKMKAKQKRAEAVDDPSGVKMIGDQTGRKFR